MNKVSFKSEKYEEIATIKSIKALQGLKVFTKDSFKVTPLLIYIDNPENIIIYRKLE